MRGSPDRNQTLHFIGILRGHVAADIGTAAIADNMCLPDSVCIQESRHVIRDHSAVPGKIVTRGPSVTAEIRKQAAETS